MNVKSSPAQEMLDAAVEKINEDADAAMIAFECAAKAASSQVMELSEQQMCDAMQICVVFLAQLHIVTTMRGSTTGIHFEQIDEATIQ